MADAPKSFGRYEPLFRVAGGGMAEVYAARMRGEAGFEKLVAVKRMLPHLADDADFVSMFLDEGRLAAHIASPHVVSTIDLGRADDGALYIVMDLVVGVALSSLLRTAILERRPIPVPVACEIVAQAANGLDDAHEARTPTGVHLGIVHRDVSPQNVLVGADGRTRVVDFGIARAVLRQSHTSTGTLKGKFGYFSPEQSAARELDRRSDVFALGIVAWETLVGRRLFDGESPVEQVQRVRTMPIPRPSQVRPEVPEAVSDAVMRALERDPKRRWETAGELATALRRAVGEPVPAREVAAYVSSVAAKPIAEMQAKIEAAIAGEHLVTKQLAKAAIEPGQATPSGKPAQVAELPTLLRTPPAATPLSLPERPTPIAAPAPSSPSAPTWLWVALAAAMAMVIVLLVVVLGRGPAPSEPVATPLPIEREAPPSEVVAAPAVPASEGPTPPVVDAPRGAPRPTPHASAARPPQTASAPASPEPTPPVASATPVPEHTTPPPVLERPIERATPPAEGPPPPAHATAAREEPRTEAHAEPRSDPEARHPAGLVGDDAFDQGL